MGRTFRRIKDSDDAELLRRLAGHDLDTPCTEGDCVVCAVVEEMALEGTRRAKQMVPNWGES